MICLCFAASCTRNRANEKRYDLTGKVVIVERDQGLVTVAHQEVKGYMPAMTMPFTVPKESDLQILAPEDQGNDVRLSNKIARMHAELLQAQSPSP